MLNTVHDGIKKRRAEGQSSPAVLRSGAVQRQGRRHPARGRLRPPRNCAFVAAEMLGDMMRTQQRENGGKYNEVVTWAEGFGTTTSPAVIEAVLILRAPPRRRRARRAISATASRRTARRARAPRCSTTSLWRPFRELRVTCEEPEQRGLAHSERTPYSREPFRASFACETSWGTRGGDRLGRRDGSRGARRQLRRQLAVECPLDARGPTTSCDATPPFAEESRCLSSRSILADASRLLSAPPSPSGRPVAARNQRRAAPAGIDRAPSAVASSSARYRTDNGRRSRPPDLGNGGDTAPPSRAGSSHRSALLSAPPPRQAVDLRHRARVTRNRTRPALPPRDAPARCRRSRAVGGEGADRHRRRRATSRTSASASRRSEIGTGTREDRADARASHRRGGVWRPRRTTRGGGREHGAPAARVPRAAAARRATSDHVAIVRLRARERRRERVVALVALGGGRVASGRDVR